MKSLSVALRRLFQAFSLALVVLQPVQALADMPAIQTAPEPWLYVGSDVPQDKEWVFGQLPNGLRYAVRKNGVPPGQVSIRVRIDAGSLNEHDDEQGFAHLIEHLVFRQSRYLGQAQAIPTWQRLGATFGSDTNAETSPTGTTFKIDLPGATPASLDESFKLLSGMMIAPSLSESDIRTEVPIVLAEKRERGGAEMRVQQGMRRLFYTGQPLAIREPIGTEATLTGAHQDAVRAFHARWYRPENTVVIVAGDADPSAQAALVAKWFGDWPASGPHVPAPSFGVPAAPRDAVRPAGAPAFAPVGETQVMVEPDLPRSLAWAVLRPWKQHADTIAYNQGLFADAIAQAILNRRLEARARAGGSFLAAQVARQNVSRSVNQTFVAVTPLGSDWHAAARDVRAVIADAAASPPTQAEINREVAEMKVALASDVEQRELQPGARVADNLGEALDIHETVTSPEGALEVYSKSVPLFTPRNILDHTRAMFAGTVTRAFLVTPKPGEADAAALRQALVEPVARATDSRVSAKPISFAELPPIGAPGAITTNRQVGLAEIGEVDFANGVKALIWPSSDEPGRVAVKVRFGAGYRAFSAADAPYAGLGELALVGSGEGKLGQEELDKVATGRKMGFQFKIQDGSFQFSADTRPADLADQLYLFALKFADPRWDAEPLARAKAAAQLQYESYATSPQGVLARDLKYLLRNSDPRYATPTPAQLDATTPEGFRQVWAPILASGPIEVQVFGDVNRDATIEMLRKTFGALAPRPPLPENTAPATAQSPAGGGQAVVETHRGDANQAAAVVSWPTGGGMAGIHTARQLEILSNIFSNRLLDRMREKLGASYAPQVGASWPNDLQGGGAFTAIAQIQPDAVPAFFDAADAIAADLVATPVSADELARVTEPLRQSIARAESGTAFFMYQLEGATADPSRFAALLTLGTDYTVTTPEAMQALARQFLTKDKQWRLAIVPEAKKAVAGQ